MKAKKMYREKDRKDGEGQNRAETNKKKTPRTEGAPHHNGLENDDYKPSIVIGIKTRNCRSKKTRFNHKEKNGSSKTTTKKNSCLPWEAPSAALRIEESIERERQFFFF